MTSSTKNLILIPAMLASQSRALKMPNHFSFQKNGSLRWHRWRDEVRQNSKTPPLVTFPLENSELK